MLLKFYNRFFSSMLARLIIYFVFVIMITLSLSSYFTYNYFSSAFKDEVLLVNHKTLNQLSNFADDFILKNINETLINMILDDQNNPEISQFFKDSSTVDSELLLRIFSKLDSITLSNREFIDSVFIHSIDKGLLITSYYVKRISEETIEESDELRWINEFYMSNSDYLCMKTRNTKVYSDITKDTGDVITVLCPYPISSDPDEVKGLIAVNIKENALNKYLVEFNSMNFGQLLILDNTGTIISHSDKSKLYSDIAEEPFVKRILESETQEDFTSVYDKGEYVVSYTHSTFNNWYYVSMVPVELFYKRDFHIKQKIFITSLVILLSVFLFSNFFSYKIYAPFRQILDIYKPAGSRKTVSNIHIKEYNVMNSLFSNMSSKINYLQGTLDKNSTIIRQNLLNDFINNRITTQNDLEDTLNFLNINFSKKYFSVVIFQIEKSLAQANPQNTIQFYKHSISDFIDSLNDKGNNSFSCIHTNSYDISVIANVDHSGDIDSFVNQVENYCCQQFNFYLTSGVGHMVEDFRSIYKSYQYARLSMKYKFIQPEKHVFYYNNTAGTTANEANIPDEYNKSLDKYIKLRNYDEIKKVLYEFSSFTKNHNVTPRQVRKKLLEYYTLYMQFISEMGISSEEIAEENIKETLLSCGNIYEFIEIYLQFIQKSFNIVSSKKLNKNYELTEKVKQYVLDNIQMEISLNSTADAFYISPYHLSRIFKKETGMKYINFVVKCKMEKAMELLSSTNLNIEQITTSIGYSHATYFCRKFKEFTGKTPNEYRSEVRSKQ